MACQAFAGRVQVAFFDGKSGLHKGIVSLEVSRTAAERTKGLMFHDHLDDDGGMLFRFKSDDRSPFWMKDTPISLDILFLDSSWRIFHIVKEAEPLSEVLILAPKPYRYVIELKGGAADRLRLELGDLAQLAR